MFDDQAQKEFIRQNASKLLRENENNPLAAGDVARGDYAAAAQHGVLAGLPISEIAGYNQFNQVGQNGPDSVAGTIATMAVPGARYDNTVQGARAANATQLQSQQIASTQAAASQQAITERQIQQQQWQDQHALVNLRAPDGSIKMVPKSQVGDLQAQGYDVTPSLDQSPQLAPPPPQAAPNTSVLNPSSIWGPSP